MNGIEKAKGRFNTCSGVHNSCTSIPGMAENGLPTTDSMCVVLHIEPMSNVFYYVIKKLQNFLYSSVVFNVIVK